MPEETMFSTVPVRTVSSVKVFSECSLKWSYQPNGYMNLLLKKKSVIILMLKMINQKQNPMQEAFILTSVSCLLNVTCKAKRIIYSDWRCLVPYLQEAPLTWEKNKEKTYMREIQSEAVWTRCEPQKWLLTRSVASH